MTKKMDIVFLLDRSGSMHGFEQDTIGGYNSYLNSQRNNDAKVTTVLFDDHYELLNDRVDIKNVKDLTDKEYYTRGCTALLDAIGKTIKKLDKAKSKKVIFVITTDGLENASREYSKSAIKELIEGHKDWEFIYIGANIDSFSEGLSIGIKSDNIANYRQDSEGIGRMFSSVAKASTCYYENDSLDYSWKDELDDYISKNKNN